MAMFRSAVTPFDASAMTAVQSTESRRSAGVRARAARILARYDRMMRTNPSASGALPLIHVFGRLPKTPVLAATVASAESSHPSATFMTAP